MELIKVTDPNAHGAFMFTTTGRDMVAYDWNQEITPVRYSTSYNYPIQADITFSLDRPGEPYYMAACVSYTQPSYSLLSYGDLSYQGIGLSAGRSEEYPYNGWCGLTCTLNDSNGETFRWLDVKANDTGQNNGFDCHTLDTGFFGHWAFLPAGPATITVDVRFIIRQYNFWYQDLDPGTMTGSIVFLPGATYVSESTDLGTFYAPGVGP